jgi:hypothetical protein
MARARVGSKKPAMKQVAVYHDAKRKKDSWYFLGCLTAAPRPIESTTTEDKNKNNDYKDGLS